MIQFYRPVSFCFKTAASQGTAFTPDSSVPCIFVDISGCGFHIPGAYPPHPLPHRADAEVMFFIVVEVFGLERVSGQLRVAPEHISENVLKYMGKPANTVYQAFIKRYQRINAKTGKEQFVVPYLMSSHPGSTMKEAIELAEYIRDLGYMPQQVQDFYPTPSTLSTCMYYTGVDPRTMEPVYTPVSYHEKAMQRALIQYKNPENYDLVKEALIKNNRTDLIGFDKNCLIPPRLIKNEKHGESNKRKSADVKNTRNINNAKKTKSTKNAKFVKDEKKENGLHGRKRKR